MNCSIFYFLILKNRCCICLKQVIMISLECSGHTAVYLDHRQLINNAFKTSEGSSSYQLKEEFFYFKPKVCALPNVTSCKSRKRKGNQIDTDTSSETDNLKSTCSELLTKLKQCPDVFSPKLVQNPSAERTWEESTVFPQLRGANSTNQFKNFTLNNSSYVIPPMCQFFNHDLLELEDIANCLEIFDFVVIDPPWRNKYIRRIKKVKQELGYKMMDNDMLSGIALDKLIHRDSVVAVWCTNSSQLQAALLQELLPRWDLVLVHKIIWFKLNTEGDLIGDIKRDGQKQPYEVLFVARHKDNPRDFGELKKVEFLFSIPSIIHSHKPPIKELFKSVLPENPKCLEIFARYLQPGFTSIGLEVLKLMDARYYDCEAINTS